MQLPIVFLTLVLAVANTGAGNVPVPPIGAQKQLVCYYDSASFVKEGQAKMVLQDLEYAFQFCDYIIYGYAGIERDTFFAVSLNQNLDLDAGQGLYRNVTSLKLKYPHVKVLLSVGGDRDIEKKDLPNKYLQLLENPTNRKHFIDTARSLVKSYNFDGLDLAYQFPKNKPKKTGFLSDLKLLFGSKSDIDENSDKHKEQFTALVRELNFVFKADRLLLSATVLPNVNSSKFIDVRSLNNYVDFVNLATFDFYTPKRNPNMADWVAPLYPLPDRDPELCIDSQVRHWIGNGFPSQKIYLGVSTYGHGWKLSSEYYGNGIPPLKKVENKAPKGTFSQINGLYSFQETCQLLPNLSNLKLTGARAPVNKVVDPMGNAGVYGFRPSDNKGNNGLWISYEDPDTAVVKAIYALNKNLGGIALFTLDYDDFRGLCVNEVYPILRAVKQRFLRPDGGY